MGFTDRITGYSGSGFVRTGSSLRGYCTTAEGYPCELTYCREGPLKALTVYGNSVQNGTPSADSPAEITGVGDRTANLLEINDVTHTTAAYIVNNDVPCKPNTDYRITFKISAETETQIVLAVKNSAGDAVTKQTIVRGKEGTTDIDFNSGDTEILKIAMYHDIYNNVITPVRIYDFGIMSKDTAYEPYGYKLPLIMSGENNEQQSFNIYLDERLNKTGSISDTIELDIKNKNAVLTKRIGHLLFNGDEAWVADATSTDGEYRYQIFSFNNYITTDNNSNAAMCTHLTAGATWTTSYRFGLSGSLNRLYIRTDGSPIGVFKTWLKEQYTASTPVEIYYQYETPIVTDISDKINWDAIPELWKGTVTITLGTQIPPLNITAEYYAAKK
ncbi:MAG: hypothetical protein Q4G33_09800 [bacterium]|nr:hypothetical protein [bacterium]